jgi:hypothetical protein
MAWARIHDGAMNNPKILGLLDWRNPFCVWVWGLSYCQLQLTDGLIPYAAMPNRTATKTAESLVVAGLWTRHDDGFRVHDYLDWNDSRAQVLLKRQEAKARMAKARRRSREQASEHPPNVPRTFSREVLRGVDLINVPNKEDDPRSREQSENVRANASETRGPLAADESLRWFERVYAAYPNKDRKLVANEAWIQLAPDLATAQAILTDIHRRKAAGWVRFERRFIPQLVRFLGERQWEDDPEPRAIHEENDDGPYAWQCETCGEIHEGTAAERGTCLRGPQADGGHR